MVLIIGFALILRVFAQTNDIEIISDYPTSTDTEILSPKIFENKGNKLFDDISLDKNKNMTQQQNDMSILYGKLEYMQHFIETKCVK
jgi:hypothetical protein